MKQRSLQYFRLPLQPSWQLPAMLSFLSAQVFLRGGRRCGTHSLGRGSVEVPVAGCLAQERALLISLD